MMIDDVSEDDGDEVDDDDDSDGDSDDDDHTSHIYTISTTQEPI